MMKTIRLFLIPFAGLLAASMAVPVAHAQVETKVFCVDNGDWDQDSSWRLNSCAGAATTVPTDDDHAIIDTDLTCDVEGFTQECGDLVVRSGATVNIEATRTLQITGKGDDGSSTITGTIYLQGDGSRLNMTNNNHTFEGTGKIVCQHANAQIDIGQNVILTNETTIEGIGRIERNISNGTFENKGLLNVNAAGTMIVDADLVEDDNTGEWKVSASGATLRIDQRNATASVLDGDFTVTAGTLDVDSPGFDTAGTLVFTEGTIDCAGLSGTEVVEFRGS